MGLFKTKDSNNNNTTRYYSTKQEKHIAKTLNGNRTPNSGATMFYKGDVVTKKFLIECKTRIGSQNSITVKKEWLDKNREEAFAMNKDYSAIAISFGDNKDYFIIDEKLFNLLKDFLEDE